MEINQPDPPETNEVGAQITSYSQLQEAMRKGRDHSLEFALLFQKMNGQLAASNHRGLYQMKRVEQALQG